LILLEPNLSMAILVTLIGGVVLFTSGAKIGHFSCSRWPVSLPRSR
jgi:cell division protein FtsW (lipid II flippase)